MEEKSVKTTLLTGSVRIHSGKQWQALQPGQQAQISDGERLAVINPDLNQVIAWKNGLFNFNGYDVKTLMQEISRWYDVDIQYASTPEPREIRGKMERDLNLSQVLVVLKDLDINCHLAGRTLVVEK
jgi:ferric-dicitrate binding protein FerR (iron transport regulator)